MHTYAHSNLNTCARTRSGAEWLGWTIVNGQTHAYAHFNLSTHMQWYEATGLANNQERLNAVSRHRHICSPTKTPPGFYDLTFPKDPIITQQDTPE